MHINHSNNGENCAPGDAAVTSFPEEKSYKLYPVRWGVLFTVFLFNVSHSVQFMSFSTVSTKAANYYNQDIFHIDLLSSIIFYIGIPMAIFSAWIYDQFGLRFGLFIGIGLTFTAGLFRLFTSIPGIYNNLDHSTLYWISLCGQALVGIGTPLATSVTTKLSQNWFSGKQQIFATITLAMSGMLGIVLVQWLNPKLVGNVDDIPTMNWVWSIPSTLTMILFFIFIRSSLPPSPPSKSAALAQRLEKPIFKKSLINFIRDVKEIASNPSCVILIIAAGSEIGLIQTVGVKMEQFTCSRGYTNTFSGSTVALVTVAGILGCFFMGVLVNRTGKLKEVIKFGGMIAAIAGLLFMQVIRKSSVGGAIVFCSILFGFFGFAIFTLSMELNVEITYPIEQATGTALIILTSHIAGSLFTLISVSLERDLCGDAINLQTCEPDVDGNTTGKDHTNFYLFVSGCIALMTVALVLVVRGDYKRQRANQENNIKYSNARE